MRRDPEQLAGRSWDVLVVGAGIYGAAIAWDAASRGLSVALVDRGDFGAATSANSLKTVHGGLRSLQRGALGEMRSFIRDRRALMRVAPHLVEPIRFAIPTTARPGRHAWLMRVALALNDVAAADRNRGLDPALALNGGHVLPLRDYLALEPGIDPSGVTGAAVWSDAQMFSSERVVLAMAQAAAARGAAALNYVEAVTLLDTGGRVAGAAARDRLTGRTWEVQARLVINAAGAWAVPLSKAGRASRVPAVRFAKAINLVTRLPAPPLAFGATDRGRFFFRVPWRGVSIFGTSQDPFDGRPDDLGVEADDVDRLLANIRAAFPGVRVGPDDVTLAHRGLLPMTGVRNGEVQLSKNSLVWDHAREGVEGLLTVVGVRYTTARTTAAGVVDLACRKLGRPPTACRTETTPIGGGDVSSMKGLLAEAAAAAVALPPAARERLARAYGTGCRAVVERIRRDPTLARPLGRPNGVTAAEIVHAVEEEMAVSLSDALVRRTEAGAMGWPGDAEARQAAALMAPRLGWDEARVEREIDDLRALYTIR